MDQKHCLCNPKAITMVNMHQTPIGFDLTIWQDQIESKHNITATKHRTKVVINEVLNKDILSDCKRHIIASTEQQSSTEPISTAILQGVLNKIGDYLTEQQNQQRHIMY